MRKIGAPTIFRNSYHVVSDMAENIQTERSIVMPLRSHTCAALPRIVAQSENVFIRRFWMHAMSTVHFLATPKLTGGNLLVTGHLTLVSKNNETTLSHFILEHLNNLI